MKKSQRLTTVVEIKETQEKKMLEMLGDCQSKHLKKETQLENLIQYRQQYQEKYKLLAGNGLRIKQILEYRAFIDKLEKAITKEEQMLVVSSKGLVEKRKKWEVAHQQTISMQKVCDTALAGELKIVEKQEQAELDERASRGGRKNGTGNA